MEIGTLKNYLKIKVLKIGILENCLRNNIFLKKINLEIGTLENYLKMEVWKLDLEIGIFEKIIVKLEH